MSSDNNSMELSRRKILGSVGAVGAAGAGVGLGTSALFSDTESFVNNSMTAGELNLLVDWEEHYSYPQLYSGIDDPTSNITTTRTKPDNTGGFTAFPPGADRDDCDIDPILWVDKGDVSTYMNETAIDAFPDADDDGTGEFPVEALLPDKKPCDVLANVPGDLGTYTTDDGGDALGRTDNADTRLDDDSAAPLINLEDVKPGDFGEVTFSTHLCDNPGYLSLLVPDDSVTLDENGVVEPEGDSDKEESGTVELADEVQTALWYDNNCDNLVSDVGKLDILGVVDTSDSIDGRVDGTGGGVNNTTGEQIDKVVGALNEFISALKDADETVNGEQLIQAGLLTYNGDVEGSGQSPPRVEDGPVLRQGIQDLSAIPTDGSGDPAVQDVFPAVGSGDSPLPHALDLGQQVLADQGRDDAQPVMVLLTDALPDYFGSTSPALPYEVTDPDTGTTYTQNNDYTGDSDDFTVCDELNESRRAANIAKGQGTEIYAASIDPGTTDCDRGSGNIDGETFIINEIVGTIDDGPPNAADGSTISSPQPEPDPYYKDPDNFSDLSGVANAIADSLTGGDGDGDEIIFCGTLREFLNQASDSGSGTSNTPGIPLDYDRETAYDELNDPQDDEDREAFADFETHCFGFAWGVPADVGNEIQSDTARFDIQFYAEQERNNDNPGQTLS